MSTRQDAWTKDEDLLLAETVLRYIREGKTQMKAFEEVGNRLSRTPQACGFRWNANLRKQYRQAIDLAKQSRKKISEQTISVPPAGSKRLTVFDEVITQLEQLKGDYYKGGHRVNQNEPDEYAHLRQRLDQYEQLIDEIYDKISEVKKREQVK